ncbi:MAG: DNA alkylation repair protein [Alistipes sp.]
MDYTSRMLELLGAMRREMNGAVASSMRYRGENYGLNYGVSLPTLRAIARRVGTDHDFARYIYKQDVRELRLAAFSIADPQQVSLTEAAAWAQGIINSEVAEEAALTLLSRVPVLDALFSRWVVSERVLLSYAVLLAAARTSQPAPEWTLCAVADLVHRQPDNRLIAQGVVALLSALAQDPANRQDVLHTIDTLDNSSSTDYIRGEMAWRLEA